jgi:integration host factor subunit beta
LDPDRTTLSGKGGALTTMSDASRNTMTKADLINIVAKRLDITQVQSGIIVEAALRSVVHALQNGQEVEIRGFGSFRFRNRAPRKGRNPKTGEKVDVPPKKIPYFKMGKELKALLNGAAAEEAAAADGQPSGPDDRGKPPA